MKHFPVLLFSGCICLLAGIFSASCKSGNEKKVITARDSLYVKELLDSFPAALRSDPAAAKRIAERTLHFTDSIGYEYMTPRALLDIGKYYHAKSEYDSARYYSSLALETAQRVKNAKAEAISYEGLGNVCYTQGQYPEAVEKFLKSLHIHDSLNDLKGQASNKGNLGLVYQALQQHDKAMDYQTQSLKIAERLHDSLGIANSLVNISSVYYDLEEDDKCLEAAKKALEIHKRLGNKRGIGLVTSNIGEIYFVMNKPDSSLAYAYRAIKIKQEMGDQTGLGYSYVNLASLLSTMGKTQEAIEYLQKTIAIGRQTKDMLIMRNAEAWQHDIYMKQKDYKQALEAYTRHIAYRDSLLSNDKVNEINKKELQFEYDKKTVLHQKELEKQKLVRNGAVIGGVLMLAFFVMVYRNYLNKQKINKELNQKNRIIEEKQKEIVDSINYAVQIQNALLANRDLVNEGIPDNFMLFKPRDIVSGDFYWASKNGDLFFLAVCDSTGHGVPGAFMSLLNISYLNEAINEKEIHEPGAIFNYVRERLIRSISHYGRKDGMDGAILCFDRKNNIIRYAAANNPPVIVSGGMLTELKADKMPVGSGEKIIPFSTYTLEARKGDVLYLYTDGYADQFGGPRGKKFKYRRLNELIVSIHEKPMTEQERIFETTFENWKGSLAQVDDVCVIGIRI